MNKKPAPASYLFLDLYGYYFRLANPRDLYHRFGKKELRHAPRARSLAEARYRARRMAG